MLNEANVCKLIKKTSNIRGWVLPKEDPIHPTTMFVIIDGVIGIRITEFDRKIMAKLVKFESIAPDYTFKETVDLSALLNDVPVEKATVTQILVDTPGAHTSSVQLRLVQSDDCVGAYQDKFLACFQGVTCNMKNGKSVLYVMENDKVIGLVAPSPKSVCVKARLKTP